MHTGQSHVELNCRENETCVILSSAATPSQLSPAGLPSQLLQAFVLLKIFFTCVFFIL
jgi:hypothetical protein